MVHRDLTVVEVDDFFSYPIKKQGEDVFAPDMQNIVEVKERISEFKASDVVDEGNVIAEIEGFDFDSAGEHLLNQAKLKPHLAQLFDEKFDDLYADNKALRNLCVFAIN